MSIPRVDSNQPGVRVVVSAEMMKKKLNDKVDGGIDTVAQASKANLKKGIASLPDAAPIVGSAIKPLTTAAITAATASCSSITGPAVTVTNVAIDGIARSSAQYLVETSMPRVDPTVDSSANSSKKVTHRSVDSSVDLYTSSITSMRSCRRGEPENDSNS